MESFTWVTPEVGDQKGHLGGGLRVGSGRFDENATDGASERVFLIKLPLVPDSPIHPSRHSLCLASSAQPESPTS